MGDSFETIKKYGVLGIITHLTLSTSLFIATYLLVNRTGKAGSLIKWLRLQKRIPEKAGSLVIAYTIYKATMPFRIGLTLLVLPAVIKYKGDEEGVIEGQSKAVLTQL